MKKILLFASALAGLFLAGSCQRENLEPVQQGNTVTYTVTVPDALATKGIGDDVSNVNTLHYEVYRTAAANTVEFTDADRLLYHKTATVTNGTAKIDLELVNDQNFTVLFWAQVGETNEAYDVDDLTEVTIKTPIKANQVDYAAFSGVDFIVGTDALTDKTILLTRPVAQINLGTTKASLEAFDTDITISSSSMTVAGLSNTFYVAKQAASDAFTSTTVYNEQYVLADSLEVNGTKYVNAGMNYVGFASTVGTPITVSYDINTTEGHIQNTIENVPVKPNYRTNIIGNLITSKTAYTITLDNTWAGTENVAVNEVTDNLSLQEALAQDLEHIVIELSSVDTKAGSEPVEYTVNVISAGFGSEKTKSITINGNGNKLNFNYTNGDWQSIRCVNEAGKFIINDAIITNSGKNDGPWNRHDIYFSHAVELNDVVSDKAIALAATAKLTDVSISDVHPTNSEAYGLWISPKGQVVDLDNVTIVPHESKANKTERAIKIDKQYLNSAEIAQVTLNVKNSTFVSQKKAAVLVNSPAGAIINWGEGNNIEGVAEDPINAVWVDDGATASFDLVVVNGATKVLEGAMKSVLVKTADELQDAVNNAVAGVNEIGFGADITGNVTIPQNDKIDIIINGLGKKYDGTITVDGNSRHTGAETLVIKNVSFEHSGSDLYFIDQNSTSEALRYPHNVTVEDCTFKGDGTNVICGVRYRQGFNNVVKNCTAEGLYLFIWTTGGNNITIDNVDVIDSYKEGGFSLGQCNEFTVKNSKIVASDPSGYGIRLSASMPSTAIIESCEISSFIPVVVREASEDQTLTFDGTNTMTASNTDNIWCAIGTSAYTTNGTMPTPATGKVTVVLNDAGLDEAGVYGEYIPSVAKVGNTEYYTIDEAIANWTNNSTLTLLADVELSDVVKLKSTEHHILDLGTYTMTAASGQHAIEITCQGLTGATYALTVNADATNPGGITATGKACIYYSKSDTTKDRPIIRIYNGIFNGSYSINSRSNGNTNCPQIWIYGGTFNGNVNLTKNMLRIWDGTFHGWINCTGDTSAYREISGGRFKNWQFMTADTIKKFGVGSRNSDETFSYNVGCYVDDEGYLVVGGPVITEFGEKFAAKATGNWQNWKQYDSFYSYLKYSSVAEYGLYYTNAAAAIAKHGADNVVLK